MCLLSRGFLFQKQANYLGLQARKASDILQNLLKCMLSLEYETAVAYNIGASPDGIINCTCLSPFSVRTNS